MPEYLEELCPSVGFEGMPRVVGRRSGSLNQAASLISITTRASWVPRVISQSQPCASPPVRVCLPRLALISQPEFIGDAPDAAQIPAWPSFQRCEW
jgi:hypothetical protein